MGLTRKFIGIFSGIILCMLFSFSAFGLNIDGDIGNKEWQEASFHEVIGLHDQSNCNISYSSLFYIADKDDYSLYLGLKYTADDFNLEQNFSKVETRINGVKSAVFYANGDEPEVDYENFDAEGAFRFNELMSETECEMRIGIKYGIKDKTVLGIRIYDFMGRPSNYYEITVYEEIPQYVEEDATGKETETEKETETTVAHKSLSDYDKPTKKIYSTSAVITAYTPSETTQLHTTTEHTEESSATTERETTTKSSEEGTAKKDKTATEKADIVKSAETEIVEEVSEENVERPSKVKTIGYSVATGLVVSAVFVGVIASVLKTVDNRKDNDNEYSEKG